MPPKRILPCVVRDCSKKFNDIKNISRHRFPLEVKDAAEWVRFSQNPFAESQMEQAGPIGVRNLFMCSKHFEPTCYKFPETKMSLKIGALPTLNAPSEPPEGLMVDFEQTPQDAEPTVYGETSLLTDIDTLRMRTNYRHASDRFYDFLLEDDDDEDLDQDLRQMVKIQKQRKISTTKRKAPRNHSALCLCNNCRTKRSAKPALHKSTQTEDRGSQPKASPFPTGFKDSCRLCFSTDQLEPLCSGMIVVRDELLDKIYVCTGILIIPRPKESIFVCAPCADLINSFHSYRQQICSNNRALLQLMSQQNSKTAPPVRTRKMAPSPPSRSMMSTPRANPAPRGHNNVARFVTPSGIVSCEDKLQIVQPEIVSLDKIKTEPEDPLEGCGEPASTVLSSISSTEGSIISAIELERPIKTEPMLETELLMEAEECQDDLPEDANWKCWQCQNSFLFQFECAKHLLQVHNESVDFIKKRLKLDELNTNMLEMMSVHQRKGTT